MSGALQLQQQRRRSARAIAALTAVWLVLGGALGARHAAEVAHVVDARTGEVHDADRLVGAHTATQSDVHGTATHDADGDACAIMAALHQAARPDTGAIAVITPRAETIRAAIWVLADTTPTRAVYRLAPKTSPPRAA